MLDRTAGPPNTKGRRRKRAGKRNDVRALPASGAGWDAAAVYARYWPSLVEYVQRIGRIDRDGAEDVAQDAFIRFCERKPPWPTTTDGALPILIVIARNVLIGLARRNRVHMRACEELTASRRRGTNPFEVMVADDVLDAFAMGLSSISAREYEAFTLSRYFRLSYREIAEYMNLGEQTVANLIARALSHLRVAMAAHLDHPG